MRCSLLLNLGCIYISQLTRFVRVCSNVGNFNNRNHRHSEIIVKYNIGLKLFYSAELLALLCVLFSCVSVTFPYCVVLDCIDF